ncbi:substrate-binding domain-containing protein [Intestinibacter bartlettii]|uniref:Helix-turn-helix transcriptional regulator n=1 Tax=Intestinibacter bartlettii TaxID=261299 RepID=A0ABS6DZQ7_9FIRM|nr:helix-turn-helix transcriptional regulator [Intestinibacter bartlettii]MBU5337235.1 helix-turn-helix transcriptional regulator [Intestinibacter bartlettii]
MDSTSLTPIEVAELLKITKNTVYEIIKRGELPAYKVGKKLRIDKEDIDNYIKNQKKGKSSSSTKQLNQEIVKSEISNNKEIKSDDKNIIICGQDMILDILGRNIENTLPSIKSYRSYMGSYNGLINLYNNKASIASAHLWDWETSEYNIDFVKKLLPGIPCTIINLTYRIQGFYVKKGNPKNIQGWDDLKREDLSYINRELGCGVRVLLDGKLRELNISSNEINGYNSEESSHLAVASAIARGKGDFGLGIEKVAKQIDNIDFISLQKERYDLVIKTENLYNPIYKEILNIINSNEFKDELVGLGGYDLKDTGKIIAET